MKIREAQPENYDKIDALLLAAFQGSTGEARLIRLLRDNRKELHEWVMLKGKRVLAYIAFSPAYEDKKHIGYHLAPMAVAPSWQNLGLGSELITFTLRQEPLKESALFVLGNPAYYGRFGFKPCRRPICPFAPSNEHFLAMRSPEETEFTIGYEPEFKQVFS